MKNKLKGFTLVEVIVALAVFSIMSLLLATMFTAIGRMTLATNETNKKVDDQAVVAENGGRSNNITNDTISFGGVDVSVEVNEIDADPTDPDYDPNDENPNIKFFTVS